MAYIYIKRAVNKRLKVVGEFTKPKVRQENEPEEDEDEEGQHTDDILENNGNTNRDSTHAYWGYRYMMGLCAKTSVGFNVGANVDARCKIYSEFDFVDKAYTPDVAKILKDKYKFPSDEETPDANFCKQAWRENKKNKSGKSYAGQRYPYRWQSHHIIPDEMFNAGKIFKEIQIQRIEAAGYNINHGHNIIFLPGVGGLKYTHVHGLMQHVGSHPKYSDTVKKEVKKIANTIPKDDDDDKSHELIKAIVKSLRQKEHTIWEKLVDASRNALKKQPSAGYISRKRDGFKLC